MNYYSFCFLIMCSFLCFCQSVPKVQKENPSTAKQPKSIQSIDTLKIKNEELMGQFDPKNHPDFVVVKNELTDGDGQYILRKKVDSALQVMLLAAKKDGITLTVRSATRNFNRQKQIWEAKWTGKRTLSNGINLGKVTMSDSAKAKQILLYSSMPGTSRHHWGTDIDFNAFNNEYFEKGKGLKEYNWLTKNGPKYGFYQPYTSKKSGRKGYEEEKWHWSYKPLSVSFLKQYLNQITVKNIKNFKGAETAEKVKAIENYVNGINPTLKN